MNPKSLTNSFKDLSSLCQDRSSAIVKFARISFQANKKDSQLAKIEPFILLIEYFQLIAQTLLFNSAFYTETILSNSIFLKKLVGFLHLMNPGYLLLSSEVKDTTIEITFFGLLCYIILKLLVLSYILYLVFTNVQGNNLVIYVWKFIFKVQGRVLYFFVTSFCVSILSIVSEDKIESSMVGKEIIMGFSVLIFTIEYFSSLILQSFFCYVFPTKNALSSKNNVVELINLTQKCFFQILQLALSTSLSESPWVFPLMCVLFGVIRDTYYFKTLPLYKIKPLLFQGVLLAVITSLNLSYFIQVIFNPSNNDDVMMNFILVLWMIIALLAARVYYTYLYKLIAKLLTTNKSNSPDLLVHRVSLIKQLRKTTQKPINPTAYYNWPYFLNLTIEANLNQSLNITLPELTSNDTLDKNHKSLENQIFINYLEGVSAKFPKNTLVRLYLTYFYAKKTKHFGKAMETILKLKKHLWPKTVLNAHLLVFEVQDVVDKEYRSEDNAINLAQYVKSQAYVADLKGEMFEQADLQIKVCQEILKDSSDLTKILEYGRSISHYRRKIQMKIKHVFETIPDYYIEPLMLCAEYHLKLNHSGEESLKYYKAHSQRYKRYEKYFRNETVLPQNLYQSGIAFFIFSAQKEDIGKIYFANIYARNLHGGHPYSFLGTRLRDRASPNLKDNNALELCNNVERAYAYDKEGFVVEVEFYINILPFMTEDLYFACIVRPVISNKDYLLVHENGDIEGASQSLSDRLNANLAHHLSSSRGILNISVLSNELSRINEAFSIIKYSKKEDESGQVRFNNQEEEEDDDEQQDRKESSYDIAKKIHTIYSTEGGEIVLKSLKEKGDKSAYDIFTYRCNVSNILFGDQRYRIFILERLQEQRGQLSQDKDDQSKEEVKLFFGDQEEKEVRKEKGELNDSADFQSEEEKPEGETIFKTNHLEKNLTLFGQISNPMPTLEGNILSPVTSSRYETTQEVPLLLGKQQKKPRFNQNLYLGSYSEEKETGDGKEELAWKPKASLTSQKIRNTQINNIQKVVNAALETHFHPKTFKAVYILFYLALIGTFLSQFALKLTIDATVSDLKIKNDLLRANDLTTYKVALLNRQFGTIAGYKSKAILANSPNSNDARILSYANSAKTTLKQITVANQKVVDLIGFLDESSREMFFENNVRVFDTYFGNPEQRYMNLTNLQAMSRIVETGFEGTDNILVNYDQAWEKLLLVSRNSLNDIMVVREAISTYFSESLADEVDQTLTIIDLYLFPTIVSLLILVSVLGAIIWQQYVQEKNNMIAFVKLNSRNVKNALEKISHFKSKLDEEKNYGKKQDSYNNSNERRRVKEKDSRVDGILKTPNDIGIKKKYLFYIIKLVLLVLILIGSLIWNSTFIKSSIRSLYKRQTQSHFADQIRTNLNMDIAISALFLNTNGTAFMRNIPSEEAAIIAMQDLDNFKQKAVVMLMNEDGNYDPIIQTILFGTACQVLTGQPVLTCYSVEKQGMKSGLVYLFASIQGFLQQRCQTYMNSNKSLASISTAYNLNNGGFSGAATLGIAETELIAELMDKGFQNGLIDVKNQGILFVVTLCTAVTVICILTWVYVLRKLRDTDIAFKKALRIFPADVIFSSFLLKSYLLKTTHNTLDSIKNFI